MPEEIDEQGLLEVEFDEELDKISLLNEEEMKLKKKKKEPAHKDPLEEPEKVRSLKEKIFSIVQKKEKENNSEKEKNPENQGYEKPVEKEISEKKEFIKEEIPKQKKDYSSALIGAAIIAVFLLLIVLVFASFFFVLSMFDQGSGIKITAKSDNSFNRQEVPDSGNEFVPDEKKPCPFECCSAKIYIEKKCISPSICSNNSCKLPSCTKECCDEEGTEKKPCLNDLDCVNNECLNPECPFICCMKSDSEYREKKCIGGARCTGRVCSIIG
ncbi:MAG: hypothetical protein ABIA76_02715 [Candidatus Diapherotrites archaeon]